MHIYTGKVTAPQDAHEQFSAAGFLWLKHFPGYEQNKTKDNILMCIYIKAVFILYVLESDT